MSQIDLSYLVEKWGLITEENYDNMTFREGRTKTQLYTTVSHIVMEHHGDSPENYSSDELNSGQKQYEVDESKTSASCLLEEFVNGNGAAPQVLTLIEKYFDKKSAELIREHVKSTLPRKD